MFDESIGVGNDADFNARLSKRYHYRMFPQVGVRMWEQHGYGRMTDDLPDHIDFYKRHIDTYWEELRSRPADLAALYANMAYLYRLMEDWPALARVVARSIRYDPWGRIRWYLDGNLRRRAVIFLRMLWGILTGRFRR